MTNAIINAVVYAVLNWLERFLRGEYEEFKLDSKSIDKLNNVYKIIEQKSKIALEIIEKPIDSTLPQEEREKLREQASDDFFNSLR